MAVDIENLWYGARIEFGKTWRVNYEKLRDLIIGLLPEDAQVEAIAYVVISENHDNRRFMMTLDKLGYVIKKRYMRYTKAEGASKSDWDVGITVDVLKRLYEEELDIFVLVSGDVYRVLRIQHVGSACRHFVDNCPHRTRTRIRSPAPGGKARRQKCRGNPRTAAPLAAFQRNLGWP